MRNALSFFRRYAKEKPPAPGLMRSWKRYARAHRVHGLEVDEFFLFELWRKELPEEQWLSFLGWKKHIQVVNCLNPIPYRSLTENKEVFFRMCQVAGIPTPKVLAVFDPMRSNHGSIPSLRSTKELVDFLVKNQVGQFVLKPTNGTRGQAVWGLTFEGDGTFVTHDGDSLPLEDVENILRYKYRGRSDQSFLIQERLMPHESTVNYSPNAPFQYRVITLLDRGGDTHIVLAFGRLAAGEAFTSNSSQGGLVLAPDPDGKCVAVRGKREGDWKRSRMPEEEKELVGWSMPFYRESCDLARRAAAEFPMVRCVGWDIVVSRSGLTVLEGNNPWNMLAQQDCDEGLWKGVFKEEAEDAITRGPFIPPWW